METPALNAPVAPGKLQTIAGWTLTGLFTAFMIFDVGIKLVGHPEVARSAARLGLPQGSGFAKGCELAAKIAGEKPGEFDTDFPTVQEGARGVHFIHKAIESGRERAWVDARYTPPTA